MLRACDSPGHIAFVYKLNQKDVEDVKAFMKRSAATRFYFDENIATRLARVSLFLPKWIRLEFTVKSMNINGEFQMESGYKQ